MPLVVGVAFNPVTKIYYFDPAEFEELQPGDRVVVETSRGRTLGRVVFAPREVAASDISGTLKPVVRRATALDLVRQDQLQHKETEALELCRKRAAELGLDMKVVKAEYNYDGSSLLIYFTSEGRVDFRVLVHDLAQALRTRVEMRQVGVRDEAKFMGGFGRCGRELCCGTWLREFTAVSIKMAKTQDLPLNSSEVSGVCGRLLCCLSYENDFYAEARKQMPRVNSMLATPQGPGKVKQVHVLRNSVTAQVEGPNDTIMMVEVSVPEPVIAGPGGGAGCGGCPARGKLVSSEEDRPAIDVEETPVEPGDAVAAQARPASAAEATAGKSRRGRGRRRKR